VRTPRIRIGSAARRLVEEVLSTLLPVDEEGLLVNAVVEHVENDPGVQSVRQITQRFGMTERTLQRLTARRIGLSPKWLIQRRGCTRPRSCSEPGIRRTWRRWRWSSATPIRRTSVGTGAPSPD
jgi:hypothetical protein